MWPFQELDMKANFTLRPNDNYPRFDKMVVLCSSEKVAWLELENTEAMVTNNLLSTRVVTVYIGAVAGANGALTPIDPNRLPTDARRSSLTSTVSNTERILQFQQAVIKHWTSFNGGVTPVAAPMRNHLGRAMPRQTFSSAGVVASALEAGYRAISKPTAGLPNGPCTVSDLERYANTCSPNLTDAALIGFKEIPPRSRFADLNNHDPAMAKDTRAIPLIRSKKPHGGRWAYHDELKDLPTQFVRTICYGFRGDARAPGQVKGAGGFNCNYTRPDRIAKYPKGALNPKFGDVAEFGALDLEKFLQEYDFRGFVSVGRSIGVAKCFATINPLTGRADHDGWVYACFVEGGFEIPPVGTYKCPSGKNFVVRYPEQEVTMPGVLDWEDVVACRRVKKDGMFDGPVYLKKSFFDEDRAACEEVYDLLSGKSQN
jgi:hypothetical protein